MMVVNSFDQWKKDAFFSAAELVQESADIMESAFRAWLREKRETSSLEELDLLSRDLQTSLGTAKWQLEEFERAVRSSYQHWGDDTANRRKQFISAIKSQIAHVEAALTESYLEEGRQPLRWVNLNEEERDDLAAFLSGTSYPMQSMSEKCEEFSPSCQSPLKENQIFREDTDIRLHTTGSGNTFDDAKAARDASSSSSNMDAVVLDIKPDAISTAMDDLVCQTERATNVRRTMCSPFGDMKIVIADEDEARNKSMKMVEATPKVKGSRAVFWKRKFEGYPQAMGVVDVFNQMCCRMSQLPYQFQGPFKLQNGCSVQITLALMLSIMLIVPFVFYST